MELGAETIRLDGRIAVVTGAARGIGRASAHLLARCGASVAMCDRLADPLGDATAAVAAEGRDTLSEVLDVRDRGALDAFAARIIEHFGHVDILVNNAAGSFTAPLLDVNAKGEAMLIAENFTHITQLIRLLVPVMPTGASIINITSIEAHQAAPGFAIYAAMKAAVESLTRSLALELAPRGIRVNAIAPDAIRTVGDNTARQQLLSSEQPYRPAYRPPLGFFGTPDDAAAAVVFLAGAFARLITGTTLHVDGGNFAAAGWRLVDEGDDVDGSRVDG